MKEATLKMLLRCMILQIRNSEKMQNYGNRKQPRREADNKIYGMVKLFSLFILVMVTQL